LFEFGGFYFILGHHRFCCPGTSFIIGAGKGFLIRERYMVLDEAGIFDLRDFDWRPRLNSVWSSLSRGMDLHSVVYKR